MDRMARGNSSNHSAMKMSHLEVFWLQSLSLHIKHGHTDNNVDSLGDTQTHTKTKVQDTQLLTSQKVVDKVVTPHIKSLYAHFE